MNSEENDKKAGLDLLDKCFGVMLIVLALPFVGDVPRLVAIITFIGVVLVMPYRRMFRWGLPRGVSIFLYILGGLLLRVLVEI